MAQNTAGRATIPERETRGTQPKIRGVRIYSEPIRVIRGKPVWRVFCLQKSVRSLLIILLLAQTIFSAMAASLPLTAKEIGLMLRSGYSSEAILRELSTRHFAGDLDSAAEQQLVRAGANQSLITALQSGAYAAPSSEIAAAQEKLAAREKPSAPAAPPSNKLKTFPPASVAAPNPRPLP